MEKMQLKSLQVKVVQKDRKKKRQVSLIRQGILMAFLIAVITPMIQLTHAGTEQEAKTYEPSPTAPIKQVQVKEKETSVKEEEPAPITVQEVQTPKVVDIQEPWYHKELPMPKAHQQFLYEKCQEYGLDYEKALAVIQHESVYDAQLISETNDYGYFQVNRINHAELAETLHTANTPLDAYVNITWGTYTLAHLYDYWTAKGVQGQALDRYVWSSYNKGITGFRQHGFAENYIAKVQVALQEIQSHEQ